MPNQTDRQQPAQPAERQPIRSVDELDREPGTNRGTKGQMRESRRVARSAEEDVQTMNGHDDHGQGDRAAK
jgi:hypothetical protein